MVNLIGNRSNRQQRAVEIRNAALAVLASHGSDAVTIGQLPRPIRQFKDDRVQIVYLRGPDGGDGLAHSISIWSDRKVFCVAWGDREAAIRTFRRGDWENYLLSAAAGSVH